MLTGKTKLFALLGHPVEHSMSPTMWNPALEDLGLDYVYVACDVHPNNLKSAIEGVRALDIKGVNVTIPHKENVIKYLDEIDPLASKMGAINTIKNEHGYLKARNTDAGGAKKALLDAGCQIKEKNILILGAGGASRALCFTLAEEANRIHLTDIDKEKAEKLAEEVKDKLDANIIGEKATDTFLHKNIQNADILINATPIGMYPKIDDIPISKNLLHSDLFVFDVIYNPLKTKLRKEAAKIGCKTLGGLDMLVNQGVLAFEWWTGRKPNAELMKKKIIDFLGIK
ncbi:MAG: shikimate dehydrogenase [Promethearchaeota archaeon]|nr:MAG: shikimate dehydrogenase [Candidatus Lokiarchaeota archaeon]